MQTTPQLPTETATDDPFVIDQDALSELAPEVIIARGVTYFEEHRVMFVARDGNRLDAQVEGGGRDPYDVVVQADEDGVLWFECTCPYDYSPVCKHAVAALLKHVADQEGARLAGAADQALADRRMRAKREVQVDSIIGDGGVGTWSARSVKGRGRRYEVQIRSLDEPFNSCTCPDYAHNMLGTCKHIEAVLHRIRKRGRVRKTRAEATRLTFVHLHHDADGGDAIAVHRGAGLSDELTAVLNRHFRVDGSLRGALPDALYALERDLEDIDGEVHVGAEVQALAKRLMAGQVHAHTADRIAHTIRQQGGQIPGLKTHLYPYQVQGVAFLASRGRALLADDMGLGKTIQAIAACSVLMQKAGVERVQRVARDKLPVVLVDPRSWQGLSAMPGGPADDARALFDAAESAPEPEVNPLFAAAERKVGAAEVLLQSGCEVDAMALLADAMLATIAARAGRSDVPNASEAAAWLYAEAAPAGHVSMEDAGLVMRADALHRGGSVPATLAAEILGDARRMTMTAAAG